MTETLYRKVGRKYVPAQIRWYETRNSMKVGTFMLTYAYSDGGRRYEYDVTPDKAGFVAAAMLYQEKIERAIADASIAKPQELRPYTLKQRCVLERHRKELAEAGLLDPIWWQSASAWVVSRAAIDAMRGTP